MHSRRAELQSFSSRASRASSSQLGGISAEDYRLRRLVFRKLRVFDPFGPGAIAPSNGEEHSAKAFASATEVAAVRKSTPGRRLELALPGLSRSGQPDLAQKRHFAD